MAALQQQHLLPPRSQQQPVAPRPWRASAQQPARGAGQLLPMGTAVQEGLTLTPERLHRNYLCLLTALVTSLL